jgi:hypothetical protein
MAMKIVFHDGSTREFHSLCGADLRNANLLGVDLCDVDLCGADLRYVNMSNANMVCADLRGAVLCSTDLRGANLRHADMHGASLRYADLHHANLSGVDLGEADITGAKGLYTFNILPAGDLIGYKKLGNGTLAMLKIPAEAARVNAYGSRKCRAEYARVLSGEGRGIRDGELIYRPGELICADKFDPDPRVKCSSGIHFFITREEAEAYSP